jgi:hypothetical protein
MYLILAVDQASQEKLLMKISSSGKEWTSAEICSISQHPNKNLMEDYGKWISVKDGNLDQESSMVLSVSQQYNGYAWQVGKMIIPLKDAVNSFNLCINA